MMTKIVSGKILWVTTILLSFGMLTSPSADACGYRIINLGTLGGDASAALGINDSGDVVGWSQTEDGLRHAFLYKAGEMIELGTLVGGTHSEATAISNAEQVIGTSGINEYGPNFEEFDQGFIWEQGSMQSLGGLFCLDSFNKRYCISAAHDIDDTNQIVGWSESGRGSWVHHAVRWQDGVIGGFGDVGGDWSISRAFGINGNGDIVGDFSLDAGRLESFERHATLWLAGTTRDLGTLTGYGSSTALAINNQGQIVGWSGSFDESVMRPFLEEFDEMTDIGTLPGDAGGGALDVNDAGYIVGWSGTSDRSKSRAVLWRNGVMIDLNRLAAVKSDWILVEATAVNARRQIVGIGLYNGLQRAFLLTPADGQASSPVGQNAAQKSVLSKRETAGRSAQY